MDEHELVEVESMLREFTEELHMLEHNILEIRSECAERFPRFVSFLRDRPRPAPETSPYLQALPESLQALRGLISRSLSLRRAIKDIEEFLKTAAIPAGAEAAEA